MTETREEIVAKIRAILPFGTDPHATICEETLLADLGVRSMHLISMVLSLQSEYSLDVDRLTRSGMPITIGQLVTLVKETELQPERALPDGRTETSGQDGQ